MNKAEKTFIEGQTQLNLRQMQWYFNWRFEPLQAQFNLSLVWNQMPSLISRKKTSTTFFSVIVLIKNPHHFVLLFANFKVIWSTKNYSHFMLYEMEISDHKANWGGLKFVYIFGGVCVRNVKTSQQFLKSTTSICAKSQEGLQPVNEDRKKRRTRLIFQNNFLCFVSLLCVIKLSSKGSKSVKIPRIDRNAAHVCPLIKMACFRKAQAPMHFAVQ